MEENDESVIPTSSVAVPASTATAAVVIVSSEASSEGFSILQKGLFLAVILGCVAVCLRMNNKRERQFLQKSMA